MEENLGDPPSMTVFSPSEKEQRVFTSMLKLLKSSFLGYYYHMKVDF